MINEKLLISYLKKQKREYNEQVVILQKELTSSLMYNHKRDYLIKNIMYESIIHIIRIYENLIERIESGEFDVVEDPKKGGDNMSDRYNVINKEEPHGQSVAENGIPCAAKYCVAQLNRLSQDNEKLEARLKLLSDYTEYFTQQINCSIMTENHILTERLHAINKLLNDLYERINGNYIETLGRDDELAIDCAEAQLKLIKKIIDKVGKI